MYQCHSGAENMMIPSNGINTMNPLAWEWEREKNSLTQRLIQNMTENGTSKSGIFG
jgi:hypothetical protein